MQKIAPKLFIVMFPLTLTTLVSHGPELPIPVSTITKSLDIPLWQNSEHSGLSRSGNSFNKKSYGTSNLLLRNFFYLDFEYIYNVYTNML